MAKWTPEQQAEHRKLWVEALRSRRYKQATSALKRTFDKNDKECKNGAFCCLGVACDLYIAAKVSKTAKWDEDNYFFLNKNSIHHGNLPSVVQDWLGLRTSSGDYKDVDTGSENSLIHNNDGNGFGFAKIASIIESEPEGLLKKKKK